MTANFRDLLVYLFNGFGLISAALAVISSFRHLQGVFVTERTVKEQSVFIALTGLSWLAAVAIRKPLTWLEFFIYSVAILLLVGLYYSAYRFNRWLFSRVANNVQPEQRKDR